jgi:F0F1-type ATP synthase membrane subunit b/b'
MARNTNFKTRLAAFYILVVYLYYLAIDLACRVFRKRQNK